MSETLEAQDSSAAAAAPAGSEPTGGAESAQASGAAAAPDGGGPAGPSPTLAERKAATKGAAERAFERAQARKAGASSTAQPNSPPTSEEQAAGDGESTPSEGAGDPEAQSGQAATSGDGGSESDGPASTAEAPQNWPAEYRERYSQLPDEARGMVLGMYKDFQAGFTQAMQNVASEREQHRELVEIDRRFQSNPKETIQDLAQRAGLDVWFERPAPEGEVPNFENPADMAKWARDEAARSLRAEQQAEAARAAERESETARQARWQAGFRTAFQEHPDFGDHRSAVVDLMSGVFEAGEITPSQAYKLATYDGLVKLAQEGRQAQQALAKAQAEVKKLKAKATTPPAPSSASGNLAPDAQHLSKAQRALQRAQRRLAAHSAANA